MLQNKKYVIVILSFLFTAVIFQNCGGQTNSFSAKPTISNESSQTEVANSTNADDSQNSQDTDNMGSTVTISNPGSNIDSSSKVVSFNSTTDILFVLDDSCSMDTIIDNVKSGIASISSVSFAANTKMATTYMSPATLDAQGNTDFNTPFYSKSFNTPGYLQLVSANSINQYISSLDSSAQDSMKQQHFPKQACSNEWFSPNQTAANGNDTCIESAMQAPFFCTVAETGVLSVAQLAERLSSQSTQLFRDNANAHIVFISDTHDPGASFYGKSNTPAELLSVSEFRNKILNNNPNIQSLRFSGVVPLPVVGNEKLTGLNVIGDIPQDANEAKVSSESTWSYSYLDFIRESQGVAMHAKSKDWSQLMQSLVDFTKTPTSVIVSLRNKATKIVEVKVNDILIEKSQYRLKSDGLNVEVDFPYINGMTYKIDLKTERL